MVSGSTTPPSTSPGTGAARNDVPTANSIPVNRAPSGTGAVPARVPGPVTPANARPSCSQNTRPHRTPATDVMSVTRSLRQVHTASTHDESDPRVSKRSATAAEYAPPCRRGHPSLSYTLKRNSTTSPSRITYSLPSIRALPFARASVTEPVATRSS